MLRLDSLPDILFCINSTLECKFFTDKVMSSRAIDHWKIWGYMLVCTLGYIILRLDRKIRNGYNQVAYLALKTY